MSSHHVVREKQEPALLVLGLDNFDDEMLGQLLEWSPTLIAAPDIAEKLNAGGIKLDYIISEAIADVFQSDVKQIDPAGYTTLTASLRFLTDNNYPSVNIVTDKLALDEYEPFVNLINLVIFYDHKKIYPVNSGFSKWQPAGAVMQILSPAAGLRFTGLHPLDHHRYAMAGDGFFTLWFDNRFIFIAEEV